MLTSKKLSEIARDDIDQPSMAKFLIMEAIEWVFIFALLFVLYTAGKVIWENVFGFLFWYLRQYKTQSFQPVIPPGN